MTVKDKNYYMRQLKALRDDKVRIVRNIANELFGGLDPENQEFCEIQHLTLCIKFQQWINDNFPQ